MKNANAIHLEKVSKQFRIGFHKNQSALAHLFSVFSGIEPRKTIWPLRDVSLDVKTGERFGIVGRNGSGKSTLLRLICGIYQPDTGRIQTQGGVVLLSNLSNGLKGKLSVKDNVFLVGSILGLDRDAIEEMFDTIIGFAGLEEFVYSKLYQLSSGMRQRISFSITIHCVEHIDPDIILLDEVFAGGGDEEFKEKSNEKVSGVLNGRKTLLMASHQLNIIKQLCDSVIWIHGGAIVNRGPAKDIIKDYLEFVRKKKKEVAKATYHGNRQQE